MSEKKRTVVKFGVKLKEKSMPSHPKLKKLIYWGKSFSRLGLMPSNDCGQTLGNLSFRFKKGKNAFIITASGVKSDFTLDSFVLVTSVNLKRKIVYAVGRRLPSSESMLHFMLYRRFPKINAIFHGHCEEILKASQRLKLPVTDKEEPYGTLALANRVITAATEGNIFILKKHGFVATGKNMEEAGRTAVNTFRMASKAQRL
ncbi:MAG: class II aldolase/adducin family protein [Candidatus Margulisiibacteriota bacterium]